MGMADAVNASGLCRTLLSRPGCSLLAAWIYTAGMKPLLLALLCATLAAQDLVFDNEVEITNEGGCTIIRYPRDRQELLVVTANIVAVIPAEFENNNTYTQIVLTGSGNTIKLLQRTNPVDRVIAALISGGFPYIRTVTDRNAEERRDVLLNLRRIDLIERVKTSTERADTIVHYQSGTQSDTIVINQSKAVYEDLRARIIKERF